MSKRPQANPNNRGTSYTLDHIPIKLWGQFKLLCHQESLSLRAGVLLALSEYIQARNDLLIATLEEWTPTEEKGETYDR